MFQSTKRKTLSRNAASMRCCSHARVETRDPLSFNPKVRNKRFASYLSVISLSVVMALFGRNLLRIIGRGSVTEAVKVTNAGVNRSVSSSARLLTAKVTQPAPDFKGTAVVDGGFKEISLSDFSGKYLVLFFYPLDFTFVCPTEITAFSDKASAFHALNASVVAVSTDSHFSHLAWTNTPRKKGGLGEVQIPLLADFCKKISTDYGVLLEDAGIALRGLFIIDGNGVVRHSSVNDLPVGRSVEETLRLVQAFQFTDKHGEVCPAAWTPGQKTIKPNIQEADEYFNTVN